MARHTRLMTLLALLALAPFIAACGAAEEPVEQPAEEAPAEQPAEAPAEEMPAEEPMEEEGPQEPQLVGNITLSGENFDWTETTSEVAGYYWTVRVSNDTTAPLDITVRFQFLDENDSSIKTETATVRLQPATNTTIREESTMTWDDANRISYFLASYDYEIVTG